MSDRKSSGPGLFTIINQVLDGLATRLQIASIELSVAKDNALRTAINAVLAALLGLFALVFISIAIIVIFWDTHRIFVSCCVAVFYLLLFLFFLGRARNLSANLPYAFEESRQILAADVSALRASCSRKAQAQAQAQAQTQQEPTMNNPTKEQANAGK